MRLGLDKGFILSKQGWRMGSPSRLYTCLKLIRCCFPTDTQFTLCGRWWYANWGSTEDPIKRELNQEVGFFSQSLACADAIGRWGSGGGDGGGVMAGKWGEVMRGWIWGIGRERRRRILYDFFKDWREVRDLHPAVRQRKSAYIEINTLAEVYKFKKRYWNGVWTVFFLTRIRGPLKVLV